MEAPFDRLQRLYDELPAMEEEGRRLARAVRADEVAKAAEADSTAQSLLRETEARVAQAAEALRAAEAASEAERLDGLRRQLAYAASLKGYRVGPAQNGERALAKALAAGSFADVEEAEAARLSPAEMAGLRERIARFQADYFAALDECNALMEAES